MFTAKTILIVDDSSHAALDLCEAIEDCDGLVAGPVATLSETLAILDRHDVGGAIVDCDLAEAGEVVMHLADQEIPVIGHAATPPPDLHGRMPVLMRPVIPRDLLDLLYVQIGMSEIA